MIETPAQPFCVDVQQSALELVREINGQRDRKKKPLIDTPGLQAFLLYVKSGAYVPPHQMKHWITVQTVIGEVHMEAEGKQHILPTGSVLALAPDVMHDVRAERESVALVTVIKGES